MKPGTHDISIDEYHSGEGISRSALMDYRRSPLHFYRKHVKKTSKERKEVEVITPRNPLEFGNAFHTYILEPEKYNEEYYLTVKINRATLKGKKEHKENLEKADGKLLIDSDSQVLISNMSRSIDEHPDAPQLIGSSEYEKSIYWNDPDTGLLLKARPDIWNKNYIADLKTTVNASEKEFSRSIYNFGYHLQCAMIYMGLKTLYNTDMKNFVFIAVEKEEPFAVAVYTLSEDALMTGVSEVKSLLLDLKENIETGNWPSYPTTTISLPAYANKEEVLS